MFAICVEIPISFFVQRHPTKIDFIFCIVYHRILLGMYNIQRHLSIQHFFEIQHPFNLSCQLNVLCYAIYVLDEKSKKM